MHAPRNSRARSARDRHLCTPQRARLDEKARERRKRGRARQPIGLVFARKRELRRADKGQVTRTERRMK